MPTVRRSLVLIMAGLSAGAAVIHLAAAPGHYAEIGGLALGFVVSGVFQAVWVKACLSGPSSRTMAIGIVVNLAIVATWAYTRTVGLSIGEFAGSPEPIGLPDGASVVFELLLVGSLLLSLFGHGVLGSGRSRARTMASIAVVPMIGLIVVTTSLATLAIASGLDHGAPSSGSVMGVPRADHQAVP